VRRNSVGVVLFATMALFGSELFMHGLSAQIQEVVPGIPMFQVDVSWPKQEGHFGDQGNWDFGAIAGIAVDPANQHVWVSTRPETMAQNENFALKYPSMGDCCIPAPPVLEFDATGKFIQGWGGPEPGHNWLVGGKGVFEYDENGNFVLGRPRLESGLDWWAGEQRISVDNDGNVWLVASNQILKFTKTGKLLLQIGQTGKLADGKGEILRQATKAVVYAKTNEVFVSDSRRVIVFEADTGKFKRVWGAYGNKADDAAPATRVFDGPAPKQFNGVQALAISNDGLVYVADSENNRVQVFKPEGTFVKEEFVARDRRVPSGTVVDIAFSGEDGQRFLYVAGADNHIRILNRDTLQTLGSVGRLGHYPGQFYNLHALAVDSKGDMYTGESHIGLGGGRRVQKLRFIGIAPSAPPVP
jgi:DNA-binding beta-propeller fold protein YncE